MASAYTRPHARAGLVIGAALLALAVSAGLTPTTSASETSDTLAIVLNARNELIGFDPRWPERARSRAAVANLKPGEQLVGVDRRPLTGRLYGIGSTSQVYVIDVDSGFATPIGAPFTPALTGTDFGVDFNPQADRIRVVSNSGQSLRVNPDTGVAIEDGALAFAATDRNAGKAPNVVGAAYANNVARATSTVLYDIDSGLDVLATQAPPNSGTLNTVGSLGVDTADLVGFDVSSGDSSIAKRLRALLGRHEGEVAMAALRVADGSRLYSIDLTSGAATDRGALPGGETVRDIALAVDVPAQDELYALTPANELLGLRADSADRTRSRVSVTGLQPAERLVGIDFRPATGRLYGVGSTSRLYAIDHVTGAATAIGATPFTPALDGAEFGVDFNPQVDRLRVVSDVGQNLRINPDTGAVAADDARLQYAGADRNAGKTPNVGGAAYTNNLPGTTSTVLNDIDSGLDVLATQAPPNNGTLNTVGALGVDAGGPVGFDIASRRGGPHLFGRLVRKDREIALAVLQRSGQSRLYGVDLRSGAARDLGRVGDGSAVRDLAIAPLD